MSATIFFAGIVAAACVAALLAVLYVICIFAWVWFPAKGCLAWGRKLIGRLVTDDKLTGQNVTLLLGVQSRREARWFFGLMLLDNGRKPPRWARIVTRKASTITPTGDEDV